MVRKIKLTGNTPRQELIAHASTKLRAGRASDAHWALEMCVDGALPGTIGGAMLAYYVSISGYALERLIRAVERKAGRIQ